jgi:23S rRNA (guanosine2251-2'-O)-methyltransferase
MALIEGRNPVLEALLASYPIRRILIARGIERNETVRQILEIAGKKGLPVQEVNRRELDRMTAAKHQGVIAVCEERKYSSLEEIINRAQERGESPFILILDEIDSPQNLGAILRTADAAGVHGVVIPERHSVGLTPAVAKVSTGAIEHVPVARANISAAMDEAKRSGIRVFGADSEAKDSLYDADLRGAVAFVIGSEAQGMRRLVKEKCDVLVRIPMKGHISCLNASVAAAIMMYEKVRQERPVGQLSRP